MEAEYTATIGYLALPRCAKSDWIRPTLIQIGFPKTPYGVMGGWPSMAAWRVSSVNARRARKGRLGFSSFGRRFPLIVLGGE